MSIFVAMHRNFKDKFRPETTAEVNTNVTATTLTRYSLQLRLTNLNTNYLLGHGKVSLFPL